MKIEELFTEQQKTAGELLSAIHEAKRQLKFSQDDFEGAIFQMGRVYQMLTSAESDARATLQELHKQAEALRKAADENSN